ncbi:MAG: hypothetical protein Q9168_008247, partial [Polycauliona sp. 1 TL-2023]
MHFTSLVLSLTPFLTLTLSGPVVHVHNTKNKPICMKVENSSGYFPTTTTCHGIPGIWINAMTNAVFYPPDGWNGAISDYTGANGDGTRFEINFTLFPTLSQTWYDADMEFGISSATVGPTDYRKTLDQRDSLKGEGDPLGKANAAWKAGHRLWGFEKYITPSKDGSWLVNVYMDKDAPFAVQWFFQMTAGFNAYINHGAT